MKTITIQLIKTLTYPEKDIVKLEYYLRTLYEYAPKELYDYYKLGGEDILMMLKKEVLTNNFVPMLKDFYAEYHDTKSRKQIENILQEFRKQKEISWELCEKIGYENADTFYPFFMNDANPQPFLMYEEGIKTDCTGIILHAIPPEKATFAMLYTLEKELQDKLKQHPLAKALKVCVRYLSL